MRQLLVILVACAAVLVATERASAAPPCDERELAEALCGLAEHAPVCTHERASPPLLSSVPGVAPASDAAPLPLPRTAATCALELGPGTDCGLQVPGDGSPQRAPELQRGGAAGLGQSPSLFPSGPRRAIYPAAIAGRPQAGYPRDIERPPPI